MRSLLAALAVAAATLAPTAAHAAPADCLEPVIGRDYPAPEFVTRDSQGQIIINPSAGDATVLRVVTAVLCLV